MKRILLTLFVSFLVCYVSVASSSEMQKKILLEDVKWINLEAISLAIDNMKNINGYDVVSADKNFEQLKELYKTGFNGIEDGDVEAIKRAEDAIKLKREILLSNPLLASDKIIATKYEFTKEAQSKPLNWSTNMVGMADLMGVQSTNWSSHINVARSGYKASIVEITDLRGDAKMKELHRAPNGSPISDLRLHWDGDRVMFTQLNTDSLWNIFEMNLSELKPRVVVEHDEPDLDFFDGTYLPDGRFIVNSNVGYNGVPCVNGLDAVSNMMVYDPKTKNLRQITYDQDSNWNPAIMNNGRVMYTRWEYTDLTHYYSRIVMHMNPDGTETKALYGSGSMFPNSTFDIQPLPNQSSAFIGIISGHHGVTRSGRLIIFDPQKGRKGAMGMVQEIPFRNRPIIEEIKDQLVDDVWPQFIKPTVINENYFIVAAKLSSNVPWGIYLVDVFDNMTCIKLVEDEGFISPVLVNKTQTPPVIPDRFIAGEKDATFFIQDIYEGEGLVGVPRGTVKEIRLFAYEYGYIQTKSDHDWQGIQSGWDIKRQLGTVPVNDDGSVIFKAPANTPISIQPIDKEGVAVQWMRSWVVGQPGEIVSCVGCHEDQNQIAMPKRVAASKQTPSALKEPEGGVRSFTFDLEIQPILDRACIACHNGEKVFTLKAGEKDEFGFGPAYMNIMPFVRRQGGEGDMAVLRPYEYHPNTSELIRMLKKGHYNVELTDKEYRVLYAWIDHNAPDKGNFDHNIATMAPYAKNGGEQYYRRIELKNKYGGGMGVDWKKELADYAEYLKSKGEIEPVLPKATKERKSKEVIVKNWPFDENIAKQMQKGTENFETKVVEIAPGIKINFVRIPAGSFAMGSNNGEIDASPVSKVKIDDDFWMSELEITNEQMRTAFPDHDSKYVDQLWKDHVYPGYPANNPNQPAIRLSYEKAMEFCKILSQKTGLKITLPTEAQWEWACRAGSDGDFWYGNLNSDFGDKENLADKTTLKFAVTGIDPQPMSSKNPKYKHYTYLPKQENVDDGALVMVGGKKYKPNAFGLYNMHGNVAEWTRSDYLPYPFDANSKETSEYKVVRGGSYFEHPKYSTSHSRKYYYPYQSIYNVGFRLIIED